MTNKPAHKFDSVAVFKRLLRYLLRQKTVVVLAALLMVCVGLTEASFGALMKSIVNDGIVHAKPWHVKWLGIIVFGVLVLRAIFGFFSHYLMARVSRVIIYDVRQDAFANLIRLPTSYFDKNPSASNVSKLIYDAEVTALAATDTLTIVFKDAVKAIALVSYMLYLDWRLTMIFAISLPLFYLAMRYSNKRFRVTSDGIQKSMGSIADTVKEASIGQKIIKVYDGHAQETENFTRVNKLNLKQHFKRARVSAAVIPMTLIALAPVIAAILHVYLNHLQSGPDAAGTFAAYIGSCVMLMSPLKHLVKANEKVQIGITAANSVFNVIDAQAEVDHGKLPLPKTRGHLKFENVHFGYMEEEGSQSDCHQVLHDISFEIEPGERVALVGASGSGKSTITSLILRFYAPQSGRITLDGTELNDLVLKDIRQQVALVSQETTLFDDTVRRNIMYGMLDEANEDRLLAAITAAHVDEFLDDLPNGLNTVVGEHGMRLSGGQRQRIAIARAIYKSAPILVLDEATSALDNKSERFVQDALETLMQGRTSLVIAHRLSTIESADRIIVLHQGRIVEQGAHRKLLKKDGLYAELYRSQSKHGKKGFFFFRK